MSDRVEDWEDDGHVCQECVNKDAEIERLKAIADLAFAYRNASFSDQEDIGLELDAALEGDDE